VGSAARLKFSSTNLKGGKLPISEYSIATTAASTITSHQKTADKAKNFKYLCFMKYSG